MEKAALFVFYLFSFFLLESNKLLFFLLFFIFLKTLVISWDGSFYFFDSMIFLSLMYMTLFIMGLISAKEKSKMMMLLTKVLVVVCFLFFISINFFMLYIMFELSVFPILVMILGYGSQVEKIHASYYLIFYTIFCSSPFLYVYFTSFFFFNFAYYNFMLSYEMVMFLSLCFLVKFPVYFLHFWLPKAHVEAPTTASMLLAGLLLKLGTAGYLRIMGLYNGIFIYYWMLISFLGMILSSFLCLFQSDSKSVAAYSSVVHMNFVFFSLIIMTKVTKLSGLMMMLSHGYISTLMFYLIGEFFHQSGTRMMMYLGGFMMSNMMLFFVMAMVFLCNSGVPPSLSFLSEFMSFTGMFLMMKSLFVLLMIYFFISFYFSIYILSISMMGQNVINFFFWVWSLVLPGVLLMFNMFWLTMIN